MKVIYTLLVLVVGCSGIQWKTIANFKEIFKEYSEAAGNTINSVENIINASRKESEIFVDDIYNNISVVRKTTGLLSSDDKCHTKFINQENIKFSFQIQLFQLEIPLLNRVIDIRQKLNDINSTINIYEDIANGKFWSCQVFNGSCVEETNRWLEVAIHPLYCAVYPKCEKHSIRKRSSCLDNEFKCRQGNCIYRTYFCDGSCNCGDCSDEPSNCVRNCYGFRCKETFRCISQSKNCDGIDDCGDGTDEDGCPPPTHIYSYANCSTDTGEFLCDVKNCIPLELVCNGYNDCADGSDEGQQCADRQCSLDCKKKGGVCLSGPNGPVCLNECPPGTFETSNGCSTKPEAPTSLAEAIENTPRLTARFAERFKYLKTKTMMLLSKSMSEFVKCKRKEFTLLSKVMHFSSELQYYKKSQDPTIPYIQAIPQKTSTFVTDIDYLSPSTTEESIVTAETYNMPI